MWFTSTFSKVRFFLFFRGGCDININNILLTIAIEIVIEIVIDIVIAIVLDLVIDLVINIVIDILFLFTHVRS